MSVLWTVIVKNNDSTAEVFIDDLGIAVEASSQVTLSDYFRYDEISTSEDLRNYVENSVLVVNDGVSDLSAANGVKWLSIQNIKDLEDYYYSKAQLQASGSSLVHFDNLTNVPPFGDPKWRTPVEARALAIQSAQPSGSEGDFYVDSDDDHLYKYVSSAWVDQGAPSDGDRVINLDSTSENIFQYSSTSGDWEDQGAPENAYVVTVKDDGDGKKAQYVYDISTTSWTKMADVDPNTLDESYDANGPGQGRVINTTDGPVKLDTGSATSAAFEITPKASLPTTGLSDGQFAVKDGIACIYDQTRTKWLSIQRMFLIFGKKDSAKNQYLYFCLGGLPSNNSGFRAARNATLVGITVEISETGTGDFHIRKNNEETNILTTQIINDTGCGCTTANVDISAGDFLQCYESGDTTVKNPVVILELAWRP